ncbi:MAG: FGGY-family carbohydrate kinase, partial [Armatimonadetes bacterium]|nr:FGGY-family carbohydrate kinase [Armatimonadota bacterium]
LFLPWCETGGAALKWYRDQFFASCSGIDENLYDTITAEAAQVPPGSDGVLLLPHFAGSGSPDFNSDAKAAIWGLTMAHERKHISRALLDIVGVDAQKLSRIVAAGDSVGKLTSEASHMIGLPEGIPVIAGAMDAVAAQISLGNIRPGIVTEITGAALVIGATCDAPVYDDRMSVPCFAHAAPGKYLFLPWCETGGAALKWYRDQFFASCSGIDENLYDTITAEAAQVPPGSDGVLLLPHFAGSGSPDFNSDAKAAIWGLTMAHERKHISRALLESVAFILKRNLDLLAGMGVPMERIISSGGGSKSALWCQIKADVTGLPVAATNLREATATGAAILAGQNLGWWSYDTAPLAHANTGALYEPSPEAVRQYECAYRRFVELDRVLQAFSESRH